MKFEQYGYTKKEIEVREMSMGSIILTACQALVKAGKADMEIRIVDCFEGTVSKWAGVDGILRNDWPADYMVHAYEMCIMHNNEDDYDYLKIIVADDVEE